MIVGIGIDIVELDRMKEVIEKNPKFIDRVLTEKERQLFDQLGEKRKVEFLGGRFACKEAFSKAFGTGIGKVKLTDVEILKEGNGRPVVVDSPFEGHVHVSISHTDQTAVAQIILEK
ncbi:holo-ACP synthase [Vagococcus hydrophili]|uniref:Holo-[acyl-carrier-protein] synthase n=1 Tax=Vagococcus hydrophili TaxID=2714947 RepID=A0A6G8ARX3_9ENTE|nr:holo-ACP synthase [Vagococcus hydrophili]QIL47814.1 holo-ACP synthase [Vagococcus hydrophili]